MLVNHKVVGHTAPTSLIKFEGGGLIYQLKVGMAWMDSE